MAWYSSSIQSNAPGTTNDFLTLKAAAFRAAQIHEISLSGLGTSSVSNEMAVARSATDGAGATTQSSIKLNPMSPSALSTVANAWTTQPVPDTIKLLRLGCNSNGGIYRWVAKPGEQIWIYGDAGNVFDEVGMRFISGGAGSMNLHVVFEEL